MIGMLSLLLLLNTSQIELDLIRDPQFVLSFAHQLEEEGDYYAAISEYKRYMHLRGGEVDSILHRIARMYQKMERYGNALDIIEKVKERGDRYWFELGRIYFGAGDYPRARQSWHTLSRDTLIGATFLRERNFRRAGELLGAIGAPRRKSLIVATILSSVVPGGGRAYVGRVGDGFFSFTLTVGSGLIAYNYYRSERQLPALAFGALSLVLYLGEMYGSANSCKIYNEKMEEDFLKQVESRLGLERILETYQTTE